DASSPSDHDHARGASSSRPLEKEELQEIAEQSRWIVVQLVQGYYHYFTQELLGGNAFTNRGTSEDGSSADDEEEAEKMGGRSSVDVDVLANLDLQLEGQEGIQSLLHADHHDDATSVPMEIMDIP
ncbi:unnamed protein product, partial [Amoebophrya sp. A25]